MSRFDQHPILGQLNETQQQFSRVEDIQAAVEQRRKILERDGKLTTIASGVIGISGLFFLNTLPFFLVLGLLIIALPLVWRHLIREAREFAISDEEILTLLEQENTPQ